MKNINNVAVIIQARLSSQRIPKKMIKDFAGTNLTEIAVNKIKKSKIIPQNNFFLSVYESELRDIAYQNKIQVFERSKKSAYSEGTPLTDMYEWWDKLDSRFEYVVLISACAPFLKIETIDNFIDCFINSNSDGMLTVVKKNNYFWDKDGNLITRWPEGQACMNTKVVEPTYETAQCIYGSRLDSIGKGIWMGDFQKKGEISLFEINEVESLDVDYPSQFSLYENLYKLTRS